MKILDEIKLFFNGCYDAFSKGRCYETGKYVEKDLVTAVIFYKQAISDGDIRAYFWLGKCYQGQGNIRGALLLYCDGAIKHDVSCNEALEQFVYQGNTEAMYRLGMVYAKNTEVEKALEYYKRAADKGHYDSMYEIGRVYYLGAKSDKITIAADIGIASEWYRRAAKSGSKYALNELVVLSSSYAIAALHLAEMYENAEGGLCKNMSRAFEFYVQAALLGYVETKIHLEQLASSGIAEAQYVFGFGYCQQKGMVSEAVAWCVKAEMQGHKLAFEYLTNTKFTAEIYLQVAKLYEADTTNPARNLQKAMEFYNKAVEVGDKNVALQLAQFYQVEHVGIVAYNSKAFAYYLKAAQLGNQDALASLERLAEEMDSQKQMELSRLYGTFFNSERASYWKVKASEAVGKIKLTKK